MIILTESQPLNEEKRELMIKLDSESNYKTEEEREKDLTRLGDIEKEIKQLVVNALKNTKPELDVTIQQVTSLKDASKMLSNKYKFYMDLTRDARDTVDQLVKVKDNGRAITQRLIENRRMLKEGKEDKELEKQLIHDILGY